MLDTIIQQMVDDAIAKEVTPLKEKVQFLESIMPKTMDTKQACEFLGVTPKTLASYREDPDRIIEFSKEGAKSRKYTYCVLSLQRHKEAKRVRAPRLALAS